jgi:hypothetical protein
MKNWGIGFALLLMFTGACSRKNTFTATGEDNKRYSGRYLGNRPENDREGYYNKPYIGGGYGWQRDSRN